MPDREAFDSDEDVMSTLGHEIVHSTGSAQRLARETLRDSFKDRTIRAREELVAEIGASFLMADLGLGYSPRPDPDAYVASWLNMLGNDTRAGRQRAERGKSVHVRLVVGGRRVIKKTTINEHTT